jgi:hypothetical protein
MNTSHTVVERDRDSGIWVGIIVVLLVLGLLAFAFFSGILPWSGEADKDTTIIREENTILPSTPSREVPVPDVPESIPTPAQP